MTLACVDMLCNDRKIASVKYTFTKEQYMHFRKHVSIAVLGTTRALTICVYATRQGANLSVSFPVNKVPCMHVYIPVSVSVSK